MYLNEVYCAPASEWADQSPRFDRVALVGAVPYRDPHWHQHEVCDLAGGGVPAHDALGKDVDHEAAQQNLNKART